MVQLCQGWVADGLGEGAHFHFLSKVLAAEQGLFFKVFPCPVRYEEKLSFCVILVPSKINFSEYHISKWE